MGRHGYTDDCDDVLASGRWRGIVASAIRGKRGGGEIMLKTIIFHGFIMSIHIILGAR